MNGCSRVKFCSDSSRITHEKEFHGNYIPLTTKHCCPHQSCHFSRSAKDFGTAEDLFIHTEFEHGLPKVPDSSALVELALTCQDRAKIQLPWSSTLYPSTESKHLFLYSTSRIVVEARLSRQGSTSVADWFVRRLSLSGNDNGQAFQTGMQVKRTTQANGPSSQIAEDHLSTQCYPSPTDCCKNSSL